MRFTLSNKIFAGFSCLTMLTIFLGLTTFTFIKKTTDNQEKIRLLQDFGMRIQAFESIHKSIGRNTPTPHITREEFIQSIKIAEDISRKILSNKPCPQSIPGTRSDRSCKENTLETLRFYQQDAVDYFDKLDLADKIGTRNQLIYKKMSKELDNIPLTSTRNRAADIIHQLEVFKHEFQESNDPGQINRMKKALELLRGIEVDKKLIGMVKMFIDINERAYFNNLAIEEKSGTLNSTTNRLIEISSSASNNILQSNIREQKQVQILALFLSLCSIALTILFWLLLTKRLATFLKNQKKAIASIKAGQYDYQSDFTYSDELSELRDFTKSLATSLNSEISEREKSQKENKELQYQLTQTQKLESIGKLAGGVAHDFNNLLTGIKGYSDLALAQLEDGHPAKRCVKIIAQSGEKAEELTRQLLAFSRKQEMNKQVVNTNSLIINLTKMMKRMIGDDISLVLDTAADLPSIMADPGLIEQILMNLAVNARDAMPKGGTLRISTRALTMGKSAIADLDGVDPGDFIQISVSDTGKGMSPEVKEKVFEPFFTTKDKDHGSGLGLATVFAIIRQHNGHISVDSEQGTGTTFNLFLPAIIMEASPENVSRDENSSRGKAARGNEIILLVDDNDTARDFICEVLELCGYKVLTAESGPNALKVINQTNYTIDLLITDVVMPGMSGTDLAAAVRNTLPDLKVIFMSGYTDRDLDLESAAADPNIDFLKKPLSMENLTSKIRTLLDL